MIEARGVAWQPLQEHAQRMLGDSALPPPSDEPRQLLQTFHLRSRPAFTAEK
jgi:hypothetical protein